MNPLQTSIFSSCDKDIEKATDLIKIGRVVAFSTETVYGLGADATNDKAVASIFAAKSRPEFNPLIVHFSKLAFAKKHVLWSDTAEILAKHFWPGPLTIIMKKSARSNISDLVSAGLTTIAIRIPSHDIAQRILKKIPNGIAAPSANLSGKISSTTFDHVKNDLFGHIDGIVNGGVCEAGIESTIIDISSPKVMILRPGALAIEQIEKILGQNVTLRKNNNLITAPGQLKSHYAPNSKLRLEAKYKKPGEILLGFGKVECDLNLSQNSDLKEAAANLFAFLHKVDRQDPTAIAVSPIPATHLGIAINDRLKRAAYEK